MSNGITRDEIDDIVCSIMVHDGPDGHVDGHEILTDFIVAVQAGIADIWIQGHLARLKARNERGVK